MLIGCWKQRGLLWQLTKREVLARYRGSMAGFLWAFLNPLLLLAVYTLVFGYIFVPDKTHITAEQMFKAASDMFAGLIAFNFLAECLNRAPGLILGNVNYVKKVVFPLEILECVAVGAALFNAVISLGVLLAFAVAMKSSLPWTVVFAPLILVALALFALGFTWFLAALGVYLRDTSQVIGNIVMLLMFLSPVFYQLSYLPDWLRPYCYANPLTFPIGQLRATVLLGIAPGVGGMSAYICCGFAVAWLGFAWFQKSRKGFADVV